MFPRDARIEGFDPALAAAIADENRRQEDHVELIASENIRQQGRASWPPRAAC